LKNELEQIYFEILHTSPGKPIGLEIWFDQKCMLDQPKLKQSIEFLHEFSNTSGPHQLCLVIKNKTPWHTVLDSHNQIQQDVALKIQNFRLNDILVIDSFFAKARYVSKEQGTVSLMQCFGYLGFNGTVTFDFESPADQWCVFNN
jgi:hypothetical protein